MGLLDVIRGPKCQVCGRRGDDVFVRMRLQMVLCSRDAKAMAVASDKKPHK